MLQTTTPAQTYPAQPMPAIAMSGSYLSHRHYVLRYQENAQGAQKLVELFARDFDEVFTIAFNDPCRRAIEIWEDGDWVCDLQPD